jgi:hypothetical protein
MPMPTTKQCFAWRTKSLPRGCGMAVGDHQPNILRNGVSLTKLVQSRVSKYKKDPRLQLRHLDNAHKATPTNLVRLVDVWCPCGCILIFFPLSSMHRASMRHSRPKPHRRREVVPLRHGQPGGKSLLQAWRQRQNHWLRTEQRARGGGCECRGSTCPRAMTEGGRCPDGCNHDLPGSCYVFVIVIVVEESQRQDQNLSEGGGGLSPSCPIFTSSSYSFWFPSFFSLTFFP